MSSPPLPKPPVQVTTVSDTHPHGGPPASYRPRAEVIDILAEGLVELLLEGRRRKEKAPESYGFRLHGRPLASVLPVPRNRASMHRVRGTETAEEKSR